jgi:hypothetical protein
MLNKTKLIPLFAGLALAASSAHGAEFTAPGAQLSVGQSAVVPLRIPNGPQVPVSITVTAIDEGTLADFGDFKVPPEAADSKPYYVHYTATALGNGNLSGLGIGYTLAVDDRNQTHTATLTMSNFTGKTFDKCRDSTFKNGAAEGTTYQGCRIFLINSAGSLKGFAFKEFETPYANAPVIWVPGPAVASAPTGAATVAPGS